MNPATFIVKRVGSAIGAKAFNGSTTSCDGVNFNGQRCCYEKKEATKTNLPRCGQNNNMPNNTSIKRNNK